MNLKGNEKKYWTPRKNKTNSVENSIKKREKKFTFCHFFMLEILRFKFNVSSNQNELICLFEDYVRKR